MELDNLERFAALDPDRMIDHINGLPDQLELAWDLGNQLPLAAPEGIQNVLIAGMGGSAIGSDLLAAYVAPLAPIPVFVLRDYDLPAWANGPQTLFIASSHSGNTEETLSAFDQAREAGCSLMAISTGGILAKKAGQSESIHWAFEHQGQPRAAIGYSFGLLLALFSRLGLVPDPTDELRDAIAAMRAQAKTISPQVPVVNNLAKRMGGQLMGRWVSVFGAGILAPVARRWKGQISEIAKAWAQFEFLPEADHNTLAGVVQPEELFARTMMLFLLGPAVHPRNQLRAELTRKIFMLEGLNTDFINAQGDSRLANLWTALHFGDYTSYYLAMAYGVDPTPVEAIESLKVEMRAE